MRAVTLLLLLFSATSTNTTLNASGQASWQTHLLKEIRKIDASTQGELGLFVKSLSDQKTLKYHADEPWYLASTVKVPIAISVLLSVESGKLSPDREITLKQSDYVDGAGELLHAQPGGKYSIRELLTRMLTQSDSTATDMLIRTVGIKEINRIISTKLGPGFTPFTSLLEVRYLAYGELHPQSRKLSNMDFIEIHRSRDRTQRVKLFQKKLGLTSPQLHAPSLEAAFERYYGSGVNSGTLSAFGELLEKLYKGELLSKTHTNLILDAMKRMTTGENRIKAGLKLPVFAQKTGTQIDRLCNMGIVMPDDEMSRPFRAVIIAACSKKFGDQNKGELAFRRIGAAISRSGVFNSRCQDTDCRHNPD